MRTSKKLFSLLLALCLCLTALPVGVRAVVGAEPSGDPDVMTITGIGAESPASKFIDAHGNEIELDDTLEAYAEVALLGADDAARKGETNLGDLWTDALLWFAVSGKINDYFEEDDVTAGNTAVAVDADHIVALWNGGNLRDDIPAGKFGAEQLAKVLPYPNKVAVVYMTGEQLREALEAASQAIPYTETSAAACASFMQAAGLKYTIDQSKAFDKGEEYKAPWFKAASVGRVTISEVNGKAFDESETYAVITSNANYNGMDSSYVFKAAAEAKVKSTITSAVVRDVVWMYIDEALENVVKADYAEPQGRIAVIGEAPAEPAEPEPDAGPASDGEPGPIVIAPAPGAPGTVYKVVAGDCLWNIAYKYYGTGRLFGRIAEANGIKAPYVIRVGQKLVIPAK